MGRAGGGSVADLVPSVTVLSSFPSHSFLSLSLLLLVEVCFDDLLFLILPRSPTLLKTPERPARDVKPSLSVSELLFLAITPTVNRPATSTWSP